MMNLKKMFERWGDFFKEKTDRSMMRLGMFVCVATGCAYPYFAHMWKGHIDASDVAISTFVVGLGITGKAYAKHKEHKKDEAPVSND